MAYPSRKFGNRVAQAGQWSGALICLAVAVLDGCSSKKPVEIPAVSVPAAVAVEERAEDSPTSAAMRLLDDESKDPRQVVAELEAFSKKHPDVAGVFEALGEAYERTGDDTRAVEAYRYATRLDPQRWSAWLSLGVALKKGRRDLDGAEAALRKALETGAPRPRTLNELGVALVYQDKALEALGVWDQAIREDPNWGVLYANALKASLQLGDETLAKQYYEDGCKAENQESFLYLQWGDHLSVEKREKEALAVYEQGVRALPESARLAHYYGQSLKANGKNDEARAQFQRAIALDPDGERGAISAWSRRALFILDYPEDEEIFRDCVDGYFDAMRAGGDKREKRLKEVMEKLDDLVTRHPEFWNAWSVRAWTARRLGRFDDAHQSLDQVLALHPTEPNAYHELGLLLREEGKLDEARRELLYAHDLAPNDPTVLLNLALTEIDLQMWDEAKSRIDRVEATHGAEAVRPVRDYYQDSRAGKIKDDDPRPEIPIGMRE